MSAPFIQKAFTTGELSPALWGHVDLQKSTSSATTMRNMVVDYKSGAYSRAGTAYVIRSKQPIGADAPRLIRFQYNSQQGYALEFGDQYMRVIADGAPVVEAPISITGATQADPCQITAPANGFANGDWIVISGVEGMSELNGNTYIVANAATNTLTLEDLNGNPVDSTSYGAYATLGTASRIFTLATPYLAVDLPLLKYAQSADVMSLAHPSYPPYDLRRITASDWTLTKVAFGAGIGAPVTNTATATTAAGVISGTTFNATGYAFVVTAIDGVSGEESVASPIATVVDSVDIAATAGSLVDNWSTVAGAGQYRIYKAPTSYNTGSPTVALPPPAGSLFGFIGQSFGNQFVDSNITPDFTQTPPLHLNPFATGAILAAPVTAGGSGYTSAPTIAVTTAAGSGFIGQPVVIGGVVVAVIVVNPGEGYGASDTATFTGGGGTGAALSLTVGPQSGTYPGVVGYFQQRRVYAGSNNNPDTYWMSKPGLFTNFDAAIPTSPSDAVTGTPWGQQVNGVQFVITMSSGLVVMTGLGAWLVGGAGNSPSNPQPITPTSQQALQQAFNGCSSSVQPLTINYDILYVPSKGSKIRDLTYNFWLNNYTGNDLTELSNQLFDNFNIVQWAWCEDPAKVAWAVRSDTNMLSLTYVKEQEVYGWARHDTNGQIWGCCGVTEPPVDALYLVTSRFPADGAHFYIERMDDRLWNGPEDPWCVDCGLALPMPTPNVGLSANTATGNVTFTATGSVFHAMASPGSIIRMGGGIATINTWIDNTHVLATWNTPCLQTVPNDPNNTPEFAFPGAWTYTTPVTTVTGLMHLVGMEVIGLADGIPVGPFTVSPTGTVTLPFKASNIKIGLGFAAQLQSVYLDVQGGVTVQGRRKTVTAVSVRVNSSYDVQIGTNQPDGSAQSPQQIAPAWSNMSLAPNLGSSYLSPAGQLVTVPFTGDLRTPVLANWAKPGQVAVQQTLAIPLNVTAFLPEYLEGDIPEIGYPQEPPKKDGPRGPGMWQLRP